MKSAGGVAEFNRLNCIVNTAIEVGGNECLILQHVELPFRTRLLLAAAGGRVGTHRESGLRTYARAHQRPRARIRALARAQFAAFFVVRRRRSTPRSGWSNSSRSHSITRER